MSYIKNMDILAFRSRAIKLTEEGWDHIGSAHPEITQSELTQVLQSPDEVRKSLKQRAVSRCNSVLYYRLRTPSPTRYTVVVVKFCPEGNFISTAYTAETMKNGETLFRKGEL